MVLLHGFIDTWRTWELVLPALQRRHDVLAPTLAGHAGGPPLGDEIGERTVAGAVEAAMDEAGCGGGAIRHVRASSARSVGTGLSGGWGWLPYGGTNRPHPD